VSARWIPIKTILGLGLVLALAFPVRAKAAGEFAVVGGSVDNMIRIALGSTPIAPPAVEILGHPGWIESLRADADAAGPEIVIHFDVSEGATMGSRGTLVARVRNDGESLIRRWPLVVSAAAPASQSTYRLAECCLTPEDVRIDGQGLPLTHQLVGGVPNPWRDFTRIRFGLAGTGGAVTLQIHDVSGRRVCTIRTPHLSAGFHQITWTGRDDAGRPVPPGIYLYEIRSGEWTGGGKSLLLR
jgi:hypothetical protein